VVVIDHNVIWIAAMTVIELIEVAIVNIPVATLLLVVLVLLLEIVLRVPETLLLPAETNEMEDEGEAIVDPLDVVPHHLEEEARETEVVVQNPMTGEEIVIAMIGMIETTETTCEMFETMATISVPVHQTPILTPQTSMTIKI